MKIRSMLALAAVAASTAAMLTPSTASAIVCPVGTRAKTVYHPLTGQPLRTLCLPDKAALCDVLCLPAR